MFACRGVIDCHFSKINRSLLSWIHTNRIYYYLVSIANSTPTNSINCQCTFHTSKNRQLHFSFQNIYKTSYRFFFCLLFSLPNLPHFKWICSEMMIHFFSSILSILQLLLSWSFNTYVIFWIIVAVALIPMLLPIRSTDTVSAWMKAIRITCTVCIDYKIDVQNQWSQSIIILLSPQTICWDTTRSLNNIEHGLIEIIYSI